MNSFDCTADHSVPRGDGAPTPNVLCGDPGSQLLNQTQDNSWANATNGPDHVPSTPSFDPLGDVVHPEDLDVLDCLFDGPNDDVPVGSQLQNQTQDNSCADATNGPDHVPSTPTSVLSFDPLGDIDHLDGLDPFDGLFGDPNDDVFVGSQLLNQTQDNSCANATNGPDHVPSTPAPALSFDPLGDIDHLDGLDVFDGLFDDPNDDPMGSDGAASIDATQGEVAELKVLADAAAREAADLKALADTAAMRAATCTENTVKALDVTNALLQHSTNGDTKRNVPVRRLNRKRDLTTFVQDLSHVESYGPGKRRAVIDRYIAKRPRIIQTHIKLLREEKERIKAWERGETMSRNARYQSLQKHALRRQRVGGKFVSKVEMVEDEVVE